MANELSNPGFENTVTTYNGSAPLPTSSSHWTAWRTTATRQNSIVASGGWAAKVDCPIGSPVGTMFYQDLSAVTDPYRLTLSFSVYIEDDGEDQEVAVLDGYDHDTDATNNLTRLSLSTSAIEWTVGEVGHTFGGLTADTWHTILVETNAGMTEQDLTVDGVFVGSATGSAPAFDDAITVALGHLNGTAAATSTFYFDNVYFERFIETGGLPGSPLIHVEYAVPT